MRRFLAWFRSLSRLLRFTIIGLLILLLEVIVCAYDRYQSGPIFHLFATTSLTVTPPSTTLQGTAPKMFSVQMTFAVRAPETKLVEVSLWRHDSWGWNERLATTSVLVARGESQATAQIPLSCTAERHLKGRLDETDDANSPFPLYVTIEREDSNVANGIAGFKGAVTAEAICPVPEGE